MCGQNLIHKKEKQRSMLSDAKNDEKLVCLGKKNTKDSKSFDSFRTIREI